MRGCLRDLIREPAFFSASGLLRQLARAYPISAFTYAAFLA